MTTINDYFDRVIVLNLDKRPDRLARITREMERHKIQWTRFAGVDSAGHSLGGHWGCSESHRRILESVARSTWDRALILEDDCVFRYPDMQQRFSDMISQVPSDWFNLYLGGHFVLEQQHLNVRVSPNVIRFGAMRTTSSYAVTRKSASIMAPAVNPNDGPIDVIYEKFHREHPCYILTPRLAVQDEDFSDISGHIIGNAGPMEDCGAERALSGGPEETKICFQSLKARRKAGIV